MFQIDVFERALEECDYGGPKLPSAHETANKLRGASCANLCFAYMRKQAQVDQRLWFRYIDGTTPVLPKSSASSHLLWPRVQPGLCRTWSATPKTGFLMTRLTSCASDRVGIKKA